MNTNDVRNAYANYAMNNVRARGGTDAQAVRAADAAARDFDLWLNAVIADASAGR